MLRPPAGAVKAGGPETPPTGLAPASAAAYIDNREVTTRLPIHPAAHAATRQNRAPARLARPDRAAHAQPPAHARLRDHAARRAAHRWRAQRRPRIALPRTRTPQAQRVDHRQVAAVVHGPARALLPHHALGPQAART